MGAKQGRRISCDESERALDIAALVTEQFGDAYWPIYDVLEAELELRKSRAAKLQRHRERREARD